MGFDLVDEMQWEDIVEWVSLEDAGLENGFEDDTVPGELWNWYFKDGSGLA